MAAGLTDSPRFVAVVGPTASGKSAAALKLAQKFRGEIVCCDSVQLYRGFDLGSAKPSRDEQLQVPHHLFDVFDWNEPCDAAIYAAHAKRVIAEIRSRGAMPIVTGGTGLYLRALTGDNWDEDLPKDEVLRAALNQRSSDDLFAELKSLDPRRAAQIHVNDRFRVIRALEIISLTGAPVPVPSLHQETSRDHVVVVMDPPRAELHRRIAARTSQMIHDGLVDEVKSLLAHGVDPDAKPMKSIGYLEVVQYLRGDISELQPAIEAATRQYAKRQCTWFKKIQRDYTFSDVHQVDEITGF